MDQWVELSQIKIFGRWPGKRILFPEADHKRPAGWGGLWHEQPPRCLSAATGHVLFFRFVSVPMTSVFRPIYFLSFCMAGDYPPSGIPLRGPGIFPDHMAATVICARTQGPDFNSRSLSALAELHVHIYNAVRLQSSAVRHDPLKDVVMIKMKSWSLMYVFT